MKKTKIVVLEADAAGGETENCGREGLVEWTPLDSLGDVTIYSNTENKEIPARIADAEIVVPNKCLLNEKTMSCAKNLKYICEAATGYNNIDIDYCKKMGIAVSNAVGYSTDSVVQHTFALLFFLWEKTEYYRNFVISGKYSETGLFTHIGPAFHELKNRRLGIIGLGAIGRGVASAAKAFGMEIVYYSSSGNKYDVPYEAVSFDTLLSTSDIVSCHAPLNEKTMGLMNADAFRKMKKTSIFLNLGRGPIVVEEDLAAALDGGIIAGAGLDVFCQEPLKNDNPLLQIKNKDRLIMTPHIAWATVEARSRLISNVADNIKSYLSGEIINRIV